jgi:hypothetical protein
MKKNGSAPMPQAAAMAVVMKKTLSALTLSSAQCTRGWAPRLVGSARGLGCFGGVRGVA